MATPYSKLIEKQRAFYLSGKTLDLAGRKERVTKFRDMCLEYKKEIDDAIMADLHRIQSDVDLCIKGMDEVVNKIDEWVQPKKVEVQKSEVADPSTDSLYLVPEPLGVVLVIGPWNFPLTTTMPLCHALAAGNTVIVKPSEMVPHFSSVLAQAVAKTFKEEELAVVEGGIPESTELLKERFDHILYTGCPPVAKIVMAAAAKHLTPVTLELGGKNPVLVDETADLSLLPPGIIFAKTLNAGQICISTDYIITTAAMKPKVVETLRKAFDELGDMAKVPTFSRIVNERHFDRIHSLLKNTKGTVLYKAGGEINKADKFIPFHLVEVTADDVFMQEEIFGPLLPLMVVDSFDAAIDYIKRNEKPLAAYCFTSDNEKARRFARETSSGGVTVNGAMTHAFMPGVPFGGVGNSGMGCIGGKYAFDSFSHYKPVMFRAGLNPSLAP